MEFAGSNGAGQRADSSPPLSSPPMSPEGSLDNSHLSQSGTGTPSNGGLGFGVFDTTSSHAQNQHPNAANYPPGTQLTAKGLPRKKPGRKPKPHDPNALPVPKPRKRVKTDGSAPDEQQPKSMARQPKITELVGAVSSHAQQQVQPAHSLMHNAVLAHVAPVVSAPPRPASSGQMFDPIRGSTTTAYTPRPASPTPAINRPSATPSIKSLVDPMPESSNGSSRLAHAQSVTSAPIIPSQPGQGLVASRTSLQSSTGLQPRSYHESTTSTYHSPMEIDHPPVPTRPAAKRQDTDKAIVIPSPPAKPERQKQAPPPLPTGSGLLAGTLGLTASTSSSSSDANKGRGANIWLTFDLKGQSNVTINFASEVEKKYGFAALNPRAAERKERQRQMALAAGELERAQGITPMGDEDMSLDASDNESGPDPGNNAEGVESSTGGGEAKKRQRKKRTEDYDRNDDFIDDAEMLWEESALMAKDGFFVYSGPLVVEGGEKPVVERADGTIIKRGRGRGRGGTVRGEGSRGGRGSRGPRGSTTNRKPRVTKADRILMDQEKLEREQLAARLASRPMGQQLAAS